MLIYIHRLRGQPHTIEDDDLTLLISSVDYLIKNLKSPTSPLRVSILSKLKRIRSILYRI